MNKSLVQICRCEKVNIFEAGNSPSINFFMKSNNISKILVHEFEKKYDFNLIGYVNNSSIPIDNWGLLLSDNILQIIKIRSKFNKKISDYFNVENPFSTSEAYSIKKLLKIENIVQNIFILLIQVQLILLLVFGVKKILPI